MGEKPTGRFLVVAGLLLASLMAGFASADTAGVHLDATVVAYEEQAWYLSLIHISEPTRPY